MDERYIGCGELEPNNLHTFQFPICAPERDKESTRYLSIGTRMRSSHIIPLSAGNLICARQLSVLITTKIEGIVDTICSESPRSLVHFYEAMRYTKM